MSLIRRGSKANLRITSQDFSACMDQKNAIISSLQSQVDTLRPNQQKYDRVQKELSRVRAKYQIALRDQDINLNNNQERVQLSAKNVSELRIQADHLSQELRIRSHNLKEIKFGIQQLVACDSRKEDQVTQIKIKFQEQKSLVEVKKAEQERTRMQAAQLKEEVEKGKREILLIKDQSNLINEKCYKTQSYIRNLMREQTCQNQNLSRLQDDNSTIDQTNCQLETAISINQNQILNKQKDLQEAQFTISSKEIQKKKIQNQIREKVKQLTSQKQKWKNLMQSVAVKKNQSTKVQSLVKDSSAEINFIMSKNNEIIQVNAQLREDLVVCQRHLQNVARINKSIQAELANYQQTNLKAISRLQEPFSNRTNTPWTCVSPKQTATAIKWETTSRTDYQTGDFDKKSVRE